MNHNTIQMMKLFQENIKKDITNTNSVIQLVQEKLKDCDLNLNSLKQISKELNIDFANIESKLEKLNSTNGESSFEGSLSRESSLSSFAEALNEQSDKIKVTGNDSEVELENSYVNISINKDGTLTEETNWAKRSSISSTGSTNTYLSDENSNDSDYGTLPSDVLNNYAKMNHNLIKMLYENSILPDGN